MRQIRTVIPLVFCTLRHPDAGGLASKLGTVLLMNCIFRQLLIIAN